MAKYVDPTGTKFWRIERDGATITRTSGKVGSQGRAQSRTFASALHARHEYGNFVGYKQHTEKYVAESPPPPPRTDDFPFDDDERLVHADLLMSRGDPLGELVVLQHRATETQGFQASQKLQRESDELLVANADKWLGDLWQARELFDFEWRLGRLKRVKLDSENTVDWSIHIARLLPDVPLCYVLGTLLEALFDLDIARSLEELELGTAGTMDMQHAMLTLVEHAPPTLRRLEITRSSGRLASYGFGCSLHAMRFPALEEFRCDLELHELSLSYVANADWPRMRTLSFAMRDYGEVPSQLHAEADLGIIELAPLFTQPSALRELEIKTASPTVVAHAIVDGGALAKLDELVIRSKRFMRDETVSKLKRFNPNASYIQMPAYK